MGEHLKSNVLAQIRRLAVAQILDFNKFMPIPFSRPQMHLQANGVSNSIIKEIGLPRLEFITETDTVFCHDYHTHI